jgi:tetratricopeptide (TPR) repeat protein
MTTMFKTIMSGRLEFGTQRSYEQVLKLYQHRMENFYRNDILLKADDIFLENTFSLEVPRFISECQEKSWKNTLNMLEYIAGFAIAGDFRIWVISEGTLVEHRTIEPSGDKTATQAFLQGRKLIKEKGMEEEAMGALSRAIEKFERHALAYERRGYVNLRLQNLEDALYDFSKSIDLHPNNPDAFWGRANVKLRKKDLKGAIADLEKAISTSIPHQPVFWSARRLKGECHMLLGDFLKAIVELKLVAARRFGANDPNAKWQKNALFNYGRCLMENGDYKEAIVQFNKMFDTPSSLIEVPPLADQLFYRGLARKKAGENDFINDLREAKEHGSEKASSLLETIS